MGICESKSDEKGENKKIVQEETTRNDLINMHQSRQYGDTIRDISNPLVKLNPDLSKKLANKLSKEIFKLSVKTNEKEINGIGFILAFPIDLEWFYCIVSNEHIISNKAINSKNIVNISYEKEISIKLDKSKRYIRSFIDKGLDITVLEIIDEDDISKKYYLYPELHNIIDNNLIDNKIYIPQYSSGENNNITNGEDLNIEGETLNNLKGKNMGEFKNMEGIIKSINKYELNHTANVQNDLSGFPIFLKKTNNVIGIYKGGAGNIDDFIYPIIDMIKEDIRKKRNNGKHMNGKYIYGDDKYYIGGYKNNIPNGKGIKYYKNGNILYDGDWVNGKPEGNGKFIREDGYYYIGQFKNGLRHGKGIIYYKDGKIMYDGDFVNNEYEGNGKYIWEDNAYYIGQYKNGLRHGKGTMYYPDEKIKYEGDWIEDRMEGKGKFIWRDGVYYIGQEKDGLRHGKGTMYYANGDVMYDGYWVNDKMDGRGKYIWEDGDYYIGEFQKGLSHGKGTEYKSNGKVNYEGNWIKDEFVEEKKLDKNINLK